MATVLGVSLGTTTVGVAVLQDGELANWATHSFRETWSKKKAEIIASRIERYIYQYGASAVVIKLPPKSHHPETVQSVLDEVTKACERHGCGIKTCTKKDLKLFVGARNTAHMMRIVIEHFPALVPTYESAMRQKNQYHEKAFQAILASCFHQ
ncbi:hypothetical protein [Mucilaginibacter sp. dw_454]|uniref:hypothetical protein n=1 Tax=Mucilaginibacter sp. dw_454 TaxID=2720079 RepID=UPI001BD54009|nr:hypothetical protein [Mucilaginibacter sp. dw_454]